MMLIDTYLDKSKIEGVGVFAKGILGKLSELNSISNSGHGY